MLENGDYTPLLFTPLIDEQPDSQAPWLRGHSKMSDKFWDLGVCHKKANFPQIIRNGKIQPELESVGVVELFEHYDFGGHEESVFDHVASKIARASGSCPKAFCGAVDRIFACDDRIGLNTAWKKNEGEVSMDLAEKYNFDTLRPLLNEYTPLLYRANSQDTEQQRLDLSKQMLIALKLNKRGKHAKESRMEVAFGEAHWYLQEYGKSMEGISRVCCKFCGQRSIFRLTLWETPSPGVAQVYRIPGLLYDLTIPEGVGIVLWDQQIIGKMIYGTPACECHILELVGVGMAKFQ
jgi:hypothetical protein